MSRGLYLFCLARSGALPPFEGRRIDGLGAMVLHAYRDVAAVLSEVLPEDIRGMNGDAGPEESARILRRALRHEEVVEEAMRFSGVLPVRLGTVFSCWETLERILRVHHDRVSRFLDQAACYEEWAVKAFLDRGRAKAVLWADRLAQGERDLAALSPGLRYLQEQRLRKGVEAEITRFMLEACRQTEERLCGYAEDCRRRDLLRPESCGNREMLMNWAFWVPREKADAFRTCLDEASSLQADGALVLEYSGPWPPYSFSPRLETEAAP